MKNLIVVLFVLICGIVIGTLLTRFVLQTENQPSIRHESPGSTLERIQRMASLVVLKIPLTDVLTTTLSGRTGSTSVVLIARGDVQIAVDLRLAKFEDVDKNHRQATLVLPPPVLSRHRLDLERSRIYRIDRGGLWRIMPGSAGESELLGAALRAAQRRLVEAASQTDLINEAQALTHDHLIRLFSAVGWQVQIQVDANLRPRGD